MWNLGHRDISTGFQLQTEMQTCVNFLISLIFNYIYFELSDVIITLRIKQYNYTIETVPDMQHDLFFI